MQDIKKIKYDTDIILEEFELTRSVEPCALLENLMRTERTLTVEEVAFLEKKRQLLKVEGEFWNEEELKMQFLAHLFDVVAINEPKKIKIFYERPLADTINGNKLSVICDMLLATPIGINTPRTPYFFLQEYKKAKGAPDAEGQMLVAMLLAQHKNENNRPIYGGWIQGKNWVFTVLHQKLYCVGRQFDATNSDDLAKIVNILSELKQLILSQLEN